MDVVLVHLNSLVLKETRSLSGRERSRLSDILLYCYIYRIGSSSKAFEHSVENPSELVVEFHQFLENCSTYDHQAAVKNLLQLGMIEDMFKVWRTSGCQIAPCIETLINGEYIDLSRPIIETLLPIIKTNEEFVQKQFLLFQSPFFEALPFDTQIKMILEDNSFVKRNIRWIVDCVPFLSEEMLRELVTVFDPEGQHIQSIRFDAEEDVVRSQNYLNVSFDQVSTTDHEYIAKSEDALELFLQVLLRLYTLLSAKQSVNAESNCSPIAPRYASSENDSPLNMSSSSFNFQEKIEIRKAVQVSCGGNHIAVITETGELFTWGANRSGELGIGKCSPYVSAPTRVKAFRGKAVTQVSCGGDFTLAVTSNMKLFSWGKGNSGQLGHGDLQSLASPKKISSLDEVFQVACGFHHSAVLTDDGRLWTFGEGHLGNGVEGGMSSPIRIHEIENGEEIACGWSHTVIRTSHGG